MEIVIVILIFWEVVKAMKIAYAIILVKSIWIAIVIAREQLHL